MGKIAKRPNAQGPDGRPPRRHTTSSRPPPVVSPARQEELRQALADAAAKHAHWTGREVAARGAQRLGRAGAPPLGGGSAGRVHPPPPGAPPRPTPARRAAP